jgi:hypothetical protein
MSYVVMRLPHDPVEGTIPDFLIGETNGAYSWCRQHERAANHATLKQARYQCAKAVLTYAGCGFDFHVVEV